MNEFIVWDKKSKKFRVVSNIIYNTESIHDINKKDISIKGVKLWGQPFNDDGKQNPDILVQRRDKEFTIHTYIGKMDIKGKKIYVDCSIVELEITYDAGKTFYTLKGWFRWNNESLNYEFIVPVNHRDSLNHRAKYNFSEIHYKVSSLKVIGTLQQDNHLLGDTK